MSLLLVIFGLWSHVCVLLSLTRNLKGRLVAETCLPLVTGVELLLMYLTGRYAFIVTIMFNPIIFLVNPFTIHQLRTEHFCNIVLRSGEYEIIKRVIPMHHNRVHERIATYVRAEGKTYQVQDGFTADSDIVIHYSDIGAYATTKGRVHFAVDQIIMAIIYMSIPVAMLFWSGPECFVAKFYTGLIGVIIFMGGARICKGGKRFGLLWLQEMVCRICVILLILALMVTVVTEVFNF